MFNMNTGKFFLALLAFLIVNTSRAQQKQSLVYAKDGSGYYSPSRNEIVFTELPSMNKRTVADAGKLSPEGGKAIQVKSLQVSDDGNKFLIYNNSKKVWRYESRGDYWLLDVAGNKLRQLGKGRPASSLMFAKLSPDGKHAAYVSDHNIYVEDLASGIIKKL